MIWKNVTLQFEVATPEDIEKEVNTQRDSFVLKASFKDPDAAHVINDLELTIKKRFVMDASNPISPVVKKEPREYCELEVPKGSESSRVSDPAQKRQTDVAGMENMVSAAENSSSPSNEVKHALKLAMWTSFSKLLGTSTKSPSASSASR